MEPEMLGSAAVARVAFAGVSAGTAQAAWEIERGAVRP
jgi:hypothetical protein